MSSGFPLPLNMARPYRVSDMTYFKSDFSEDMKPIMSLRASKDSRSASVVSSISGIATSAKKTVSKLNSASGDIVSYVNSTASSITNSALISGITRDKANLTGDVLRSADGVLNYLKAESGNNIASWEWSGVKVKIPGSIVGPLQGAQTILGSIQTILEVLKAAMEVVKALAVGLSDILKVLIDSVVSALNSLLDLFTVDASVHLLAVPPVSKKFVSSKIESQYEFANKVLASADSAAKVVSDVFSGFEPNVQNTGGNAGFYSAVKRKLEDVTDINRPQYLSNEYIAGGMFIVGGGLSYVINLYSQLAYIFSVPIKKEVDYLPKAKSIDSANIGRPREYLTIQYTDYTAGKSRVKFSERYQVVSSVDFLVVVQQDKESSAAVTASLNSLVYTDGMGLKEGTSISGLSNPAEGIQIIRIDSSAYTKSIYTGSIKVKLDSSLSENSKYRVYLVTTYQYFDSESSSKVFEYITLRSQAYTLITPIDSIGFINSGSGKFPNWINAGSCFDIIPVLDTVRGLVQSISVFLKSFISDVNIFLERILAQLVETLSYISQIVDRINSFLELLKTLAGIGAGAAIAIFQGYGGNDLFNLILKDCLLNPSENSNSTTTGPHSTTSVDINKRIYFNENESVAGIVVVSGSKQISSAIKIAELLKMLFTTDSRENSTVESENLVESLGSRSTSLVQAYVPDSNSIARSEVIPGGFTEGMLPTADYNKVQEDYCAN